MKRWWNGLSNKGRLLTGAGGVAVLLITMSLVAPDDGNDSASADPSPEQTASTST
ncbi:hypothetical protein EDF38_1761 [Frigoribacterium sp. PhB160]|nr:hypothetical protein EDF38_1761 [Frigoribacterium sp. PhB160]